MKKFIMIIALIAGIIGTNNVFAKECETTEEVKQDTAEECYVHPADGVVTCND